MAVYSDIEYSVDDPVALIRLNRPAQLNAFTRRTLTEIRQAIGEAAADRRVVGIIITGNGRAFCAGLDLADLTRVTSSSEPPAPTPEDQLPGLFTYLLEVPKPVISAINGVVVGGGLILALMSDLRFASSAASLSTIFLKRGLVAEHGSTWLLPRLVGLGRALDLLWMSDRIGAEEAQSLGLVDRVFEPENLLTSACDYVRRLAETSPPTTIAETKRLVYRHVGTDYVTALREAEVAQNQAVANPDATEGARAFIEKRPPRFQRIGT